MPQGISHQDLERSEVQPMNILYKPKGPAKEYADDPIMRTEGWAANLYHGCTHGCGYCYVPDNQFWIRKGNDRREMFHSCTFPRKNVLHKLELDLKRSAGMTEPVFLSFTSDIYQPFLNSVDVTREALLLCEKYEIAVTILTKGAHHAERDFDIIARNGWKFGTTLTGGGAQFEPDAPSQLERIRTIRQAHALGIYTWVSMEPILSLAGASACIKLAEDVVDFWKVGKLNHGKTLGEPYASIEADTDWNEVLEWVESNIPREKLLIKHDLEAHRDIGSQSTGSSAKCMEQ
jgi:DNA repair photolyase